MRTNKTKPFRRRSYDRRGDRRRDLAGSLSDLLASFRGLRIRLEIHPMPGHSAFRAEAATAGFAFGFPADAAGVPDGNFVAAGTLHHPAPRLGFHRITPASRHEPIEQVPGEPHAVAPVRGRAATSEKAADRILSPGAALSASRHAAPSSDLPKPNGTASGTIDDRQAEERAARRSESGSPSLTAPGTES